MVGSDDNKSAMVDVGNPHLAVTPSHIDTGTVQTVKGMRGIVTTRTSSCTVTEFLTRRELINRARVLSELAAQLPEEGTGLIVGGSINGL